MNECIIQLPALRSRTLPNFGGRASREASRCDTSRRAHHITMASEDLLQPGHVVKERWKVSTHHLTFTYLSWLSSCLKLMVLLVQWDPNCYDSTPTHDK